DLGGGAEGRAGRQVRQLLRSRWASAAGTHVPSRVQKALQRNVPLRAMFECTTVEELASYIESLAPSEISEQKAERLNDLMSKLEML
ncbi:hypothetical protein JR315_00600, partial [Pseudomonas aeruginosa]|uniref:hypothetical protein n=1 Tax=Pseudomonas aeruginosa TaxID=287 RepID=UPI0022EA88BE